MWWCHLTYERISGGMEARIQFDGLLLVIENFKIALELPTRWTAGNGSGSGFRSDVLFSFVVF